MIKLARTGLARFQGCMPSIITPTSRPTSRQPTSTRYCASSAIGSRVFMVKEETRSSTILLDWLGTCILVQARTGLSSELLISFCYGWVVGWLGWAGVGLIKPATGEHCYYPRHACREDVDCLWRNNGHAWLRHAGLNRDFWRDVYGSIKWFKSNQGERETRKVYDWRLMESDNAAVFELDCVKGHGGGFPILNFHTGESRGWEQKDFGKTDLRVLLTRTRYKIMAYILCVFNFESFGFVVSCWFIN